MYKSLGLISIVVAWVGLSILIFSLKKGPSLTISRHAVTNKKTYLAMAIFETITLSAYYLFVIKWFAPHFQLGPVYTTMMGLSVLGLLIAAWVPDTEGLKHNVHEFCGYGAFLLFIPALTLLLDSSHIAGIAKVFIVPTIAYMVTSILLFFLSAEVRRYHLYFQVAYLASVHVVILLATYVH